jgi:hypothetical protein
MRRIQRLGELIVKPHNQHAPGLGRLNDQLGALAKHYRRYVDKELAEAARRRADKGVAGEREAA